MSEAIDRFGIGANRGPELDPFETLKKRTEELLAEAEGSWKGIVEIAGPEQAGRADTFLNQVGSFNLKKTAPVASCIISMTRRNARSNRTVTLSSTSKIGMTRSS